MMKNFRFLSAFGLISTLLNTQLLFADEAFVVLEHNSTASLRSGSRSDYLVQPGDTLARIVSQHYGYLPNQQDVFRQIVEQNPHAFVGRNPNRLLSGVILNLSGSGSASGSISDEIYFF